MTFLLVKFILVGNLFIIVLQKAKKVLKESAKDTATLLQSRTIMNLRIEQY